MEKKKNTKSPVLWYFKTIISQTITYLFEACEIAKKKMLKETKWRVKNVALDAMEWGHRQLPMCIQGRVYIVQTQWHSAVASSKCILYILRICVHVHGLFVSRHAFYLFFFLLLLLLSLNHSFFFIKNFLKRL